MAKQLKEFEIPFGAKDSELCGWEYSIPEGMEATIVDNKIVVKKKESEDERIREELLNAFQESEDSLYMVLTPQRRESFIAWLEKQGEQKSAWSKGDERIRQDIENLIHFALREGSAVSPAAETTKEDAISWIQSLKDRVQPKQEWSEEDEMMLECVLDKIGDLGTGEMCKEWLKKKLKG